MIPTAFRSLPSRVALGRSLLLGLIELLALWRARRRLD